MTKVVKIGENTLRRLVRESLEKHLNEMQGTNDPRQKAQEIKDKLITFYNMEERGHTVRVFDEDDYDIQVGVWGNMNVPAIADCRMVAEEFDCEGEYDNSWGVFTIYVR